MYLLTYFGDWTGLAFKDIRTSCEILWPYDQMWPYLNQRWWDLLCYVFLLPNHKL